MKYEIKEGNRWLTVSHWIWRSWTGDRKINGNPTTGPTYLLGTNTTRKDHTL